MGAPDAVRPEYRKLASDLPTLAAPFGCALPKAVLRDVETFTLAMECVDRLLDGIADPRARRVFGDAVMAALEETAPPGAAGGPDFTAELEARLFALREVLARRRVSERFCQLARQALSNTELIRSLASRIFLRLAAVRLSSCFSFFSSSVLLRPSNCLSGARRSCDTA